MKLIGDKPPCSPTLKERNLDFWAAVSVSVQRARSLYRKPIIWPWVGMHVAFSADTKSHLTRQPRYAALVLAPQPCIPSSVTSRKHLSKRPAPVRVNTRRSCCHRATNHSPCATLPTSRHLPCYLPLSQIRIPQPQHCTRSNG